MKLDFSVPISAYELLALIMSGLALAVPIIRFAWKKWITKAKIDFLLAGNAKLFFNQSGSYMQIDGVITSENKASTIRKMSINIKRKKDEKKLNLTWKRLISPVNQNLVGNYLLTTENAHPIRILEDNVVCVFAQYGDPFDSFEKKFISNTEDLFKAVSVLVRQFALYDDAILQYKALPAYSEARNMMQSEFFWEIGKYELEIDIEYDNVSKKKYTYAFSVSEHEYQELSKNFDESLISPLKSAYRQQWDYRSPSIELIKQEVKTNE